MIEALDIGRINVVIVERLETLRLCVTCDPYDDREELIRRFRPEGREWEIDGPILDAGDHMYIKYCKLTQPNSGSQ